jgi:hypothetical protein
MNFNEFQNYRKNNRLENVSKFKLNLFLPISFSFIFHRINFSFQVSVFFRASLIQLISLLLMDVDIIIDSLEIFTFHSFHCLKKEWILTERLKTHQSEY